MEDLDDLYLFMRVIDAGGFSAAERSTGIPKSRLSRRIAALETRLGVRLIQRSAHSFHATAIGESVYRHARAIADEAEAVRATVSQTLAEPSGLIRVSSSLLTGELLLSGWLADFMNLYPKVRISLDLSNRYVDLLEERIDLAIRFSSMPLDSADIVARPIGQAGMVLVASPSFLAAHGEPDALEDLGRFPALAQGSLEAIRPWVFKDASGARLMHQPQARFITDNILALREAALRGAGLVQLPTDACKDALRDGSLRILLPQLESVGATVYAIYPSRRGMTSAVRTLISYLEERFQSS